LPRVVDLVADSGIAVIAAGGIVDARGYVAALALGAQGVCLGTRYLSVPCSFPSLLLTLQAFKKNAHIEYSLSFRFLATEESFAHPLYKQRLLEINRTDYTDVFGRARWPDAPHRVLETPFYVELKKKLSDHRTEENQPIIGQSIIHGMVCI
jgi:NAD(P)H-dependent flavin oxidoreductase YrpB (nitropropane dioxygenase family)